MKDGILVSQILIDILNAKMDMPANAVWIRDQNRTIPNDEGLYIVVGMTSAIPYYNTVSMESRDDGDYEIQCYNQLENIQIDIASRAKTALQRAWEIPASLQSFYGQQMQELHNFKISRLPRNFVDTSSAEGGSMINRYTITISAMAWYRKEVKLTSKLGDYYNDFKQRVDDDKTIGTDNPMVQFEITEGGILP